jgi:outer membrane lipoprotein
MMTHHRLEFLTLGLILLLASGCATMPIAKEYRNEAAAQNITFSMVLQNPDAYVGRTVLWGGSIIETKNISSGTDIIVLQTPLNRGETPLSPEYSQGRFIARSTYLLDPEIYQRGRKITLAGVLGGKETLPLGETTYTYPVVAVKQLYLWPKPRQYAYPYPYYYDGWGPYWAWGPYWGWGPPYGYFEFYGDFDGRDGWHGHHGNRGGGEPGEHGGGREHGPSGDHGGGHGRGGDTH